MLETDYLVIGAGAMGMAFTDVILDETDATVTIVDRANRPGGHWNDAYPFVRLHQPSAFYGVNSRPLGSDRIDTDGWNAGLYELASGAEVVAYYDQVMNQQFIPSGRVTYFPMHEFAPNGRSAPSGPTPVASCGSPRCERRDDRGARAPQARRRHVHERHRSLSTSAGLRHRRRRSARPGQRTRTR